MAHWAGLGYYARARNLHAAARHCVQRHGGDLPRDFDALLALPGIGRSTAGAILAQAWGERFPILDGNVKRVLARWHGIEGWPGTPAVEKQLWALAGAHLDEVPAGRMADYTQAQMDFGASQCTRSAPACPACPLAAGCSALRDGRVDTLPTPRPGKVLPEREAIALLLENDRGQLLLVQFGGVVDAGRARAQSRSPHSRSFRESSQTCFLLLPKTTAMTSRPLFCPLETRQWPAASV